jgi:hypothetical protein
MGRAVRDPIVKNNERKTLHYKKQKRKKTRGKKTESNRRQNNSRSKRRITKDTKENQDQPMLENNILFCEPSKVVEFLAEF